MTTMPAGPATRRGEDPTGVGDGAPHTRRTGAWAVVVVVLAGLGFALPVVLSGSSMRFVLEATILGLFALSLGFLAGHVGLVSLAHGVFYGGAGYTMAIVLSGDLGVHVAVAIALVVSLLLSLVIGAVSIRVPGIGFAIVTLAVGEVAFLSVGLNRLRPLFGGFDGRPVSAESFLGISDVTGIGLWPAVWGTVIISVTSLWLLRRSAFGVLLAAIRDNDERARFSGFDTFVPRLLAFAATGVMAAAAGVLAALNTAYVSPPNIFWFGTAFALIAALIGGAGSLAGPFIGAFIIQAVEERFAIGGGVNLYLGLLFVVLFVASPSGLTGLWSRTWSSWRARGGSQELRGS